MHFLTGVLILSVAIASQAMQQSVGLDAVERESSYVLGSNDRIVVRCVDVDEFTSTPMRIDNDGQVTLPLVGRLKLAGLTVSEAEKKLATKLSEFIQHPQIQILVVDSRSQPVSVFGAVRNPGAYQLDGRKTLAEVLSMAGGLRPDAGQTLKLTRRLESGSIPLPAASQRTTGDVAVAEISIDELVRGNAPFTDIEVRPHDVISVTQAELVYVVGQVRKPGGFAMSAAGDFTVLQALSMAEGLDRTAAPKKSMILRKRAGSGRIELPVDLERILSGHDLDTALQADDVLFVPNNSAKSAGMKTLDAIIQTTTGMAIYGRF